MSLCTQKPRVSRSDNKENLPIHRANSFTSADRKTERKIAEKESVDSCLWLVAAGFPQYVHMFEEGRFPIEFSLADLSRDHEFLDTSSLSSLLKRLEVLNDCSTMNIQFSRVLNLETEGEQLRPLSRLWEFRENPRSWTRRDRGQIAPLSTQPINRTKSPVTNSNYSTKSGSMDFLSTAGAERGSAVLSHASSLTPLSCLRSPAARSVSTSSLASVAYTDSIPYSHPLRSTATPGRSTERRLPPNSLAVVSPPVSGCRSDSSLSPGQTPGTPGQAPSLAPSCDTFYSCFDSLPLSPTALPHNNIRSSYLHSNSSGREECTQSQETSGDSIEFSLLTSRHSLDGLLDRVNGMQQDSIHITDSHRLSLPMGDRSSVRSPNSCSPDTPALPALDPAYNAREQVAMATEGMPSPLPGSQTVMRPLPATRRVREYRWEASVTRDTDATSSTPMYELSVNQIVTLKKLALIQLTALLERHTSTSKAKLSLSQLVSNNRPQKFHQNKANQIFGLPLSKVLERTGQSVPQVILSAMKFILEEATDSVGIFRRNAAKSKLEALKAQCESSACRIDFSDVIPYEAASLIKSYFRELPEPLITYRLSNTLLNIFTSFPESCRSECVQCVMLLLPDCNREALHSLLFFLRGVAQSQLHNKMDAYNLAVCFAPTLFAISSEDWTPSKKPQKRYGSYFPTADLLNAKEVIQSKACTKCLTFLISNCEKLFMVPADLLRRCESAEEQSPPAPLSPLCPPAPLSPLCPPRDPDTSFSARLHSDYKSLITNRVQLLLMDTSRGRSWRVYRSGEGVELSHRATQDSLIPLWRAVTSIQATQEALLRRILEERNMWDEDIARWQVIPLDHQTEVFRYATHSMYGPHPPREYCVIRSWHLDTCSGAVVLHSMSIRERRRESWSDLTSIQGELLNETFVIQKTSHTECRLVMFSQVDTRGRSPEFYMHYGPYLVSSVLLLKNSFKQSTFLSHKNCVETQV